MRFVSSKNRENKKCKMTSVIVEIETFPVVKKSLSIYIENMLTAIFNFLNVFAYNFKISQDFTFLYVNLLNIFDFSHHFQ